jgi:hypothetical protein
MIEQLISASEFRIYKTIPATFPSDMLAVCVVRAQESELRDLLGKALYKQVLDNRGDEPYISLIKGTDYEKDGLVIDFRGLVPFLVWTSYRYVLKETMAQMTNSGAKIKTSPESETPSDSWYATEIQEAQAQAAQWAGEVQDYINVKIADFPNYRPEPNRARGSFSITNVLQPKFASGK